MHCHMLIHTDDGMMGSLVIAEAGDHVEFQSATLIWADGTVVPTPLTVVVTNNKFTAALSTLTGERNLVRPGWHMLFLTDNAGVVGGPLGSSI